MNKAFGSQALTALKAFAALVTLAAAMILLASCEGDYLGPAERGARAAFNGWDMWQTPAVRPYETPMPTTPPGAVPVQRGESFDTAPHRVQKMDPVHREAAGRKAYGRFCNHCHGPNGDGRIIVQRDSQPLGGQRPTTSWLPGEFLRDPYALPLPVDLPPPPYRLIVGLYDPASGVRLPVGETDAIDLSSAPLTTP